MSPDEKVGLFLMVVGGTLLALDLITTWLDRRS